MNMPLIVITPQDVRRLLVAPIVDHFSLLCFTKSRVPALLTVAVASSAAALRSRRR